MADLAGLRKKIERNPDLFLQARGALEHWHYVRRVPRKYHSIDSRGMIRITLGTLDLPTARARRTALAEADDLFWTALMRGEGGASARYEAARTRAAAHDLEYLTASEIAAGERGRQLMLS